LSQAIASGKYHATAPEKGRNREELMFTICRNVAGVALAIGMGAGMTLAAPTAASAQVVLSYSPWLPGGYPLNDAVLRPWMEEVERITEGRVTFNWLPTAVGTAVTQFDVVQDGLADMSLVLPGFTPGRFELLELGELPLLSSEPAVLGPTFYEVYVEHLDPLRPLAGTHVISLWATIPTHIVSSRGLIENVSDMRGQKLRSPSATAVSVMEQLGAVPVQAPTTEIYQLATTGVIDGSFFPISTTYDFNLDDVLNYMTLVPGGLGQSVMMLLVNEAKWNRISEEDQAAIMDISGLDFARQAGELFGGLERAAIERAQTERPSEVKVAGPELVEAIEQAIQPVYEAWHAKAEAKGLENADAVLLSFRTTLSGREDEFLATSREQNPQ
jgi:TRAP-type transport system periplasmic protein